MTEASTRLKPIAAFYVFVHAAFLNALVESLKMYKCSENMYIYIFSEKMVEEFETI